MELIKKQIHMNQWKGNAVTQITLDEDFIVPDTLEDMEQVILEQAHIQGENVKTPGGEDHSKRKTGISGPLQKRKWGLETLGGNISFEETVNVPGLAEGDHTGLNWILEDMKTDMINSRKLGVKAVITVEIHTEGETSQMAASDLKETGTAGSFQVRQKKCPGSENGKHFSCYTGSSP